MANLSAKITPNNLVTLTGTQILTNKTLTSPTVTGTVGGSSRTLSGSTKVTEFQETYASLSGTTPTINLENGTAFSITTSGNTTFTFSNPAPSGTVSAFTLAVTAGGTHTLTFPASVDWAGGTAPSAPASGATNIYTFFTRDGGTTWYGFLAGEGMA